MPFAAAYTAEIDDRRGRLVTVTLEQGGYEGSEGDPPEVQPFELAETPAVRQGSKPSSDELEPLRPQLVRLRVPPVHSGIIDAIYANAKAWRVRVEIDDQLDFYGPLRKNLRTRGIDLFQEPTELTANCGLGGLQSAGFRAADGSLLEEPDSIRGWIQFCLAKIGTGLPLATASEWFAREMDPAQDPLGQELIDPARYLQRNSSGDDGKPLSCFEVLQDLTRGKEAVLTQEAGLWRFYQRARFYDAASSEGSFAHVVYQPGSSAGQSSMHQAVTEVPEPLSGRLEGALEPTRQSYGAVQVTYEHGAANLLPNPTLEFERGEGTTVRGYYRPGPFEDVEGWDFTDDLYVYENRGVEEVRNTLAMPVREGGYEGQTVSGLLSSYLRMSRSMLVEQSTSPRLQVQVTCRPDYGPVRRGQGPSVDPYVLFGYLEVRLDASDDRTFWLYRPYEGEAEWVEGEERFVTCGAVLDEETEITLLTPELPADGAVTFAFREGIDAEAARWEEEGREFYFPRETNSPAHYTPAARWLWHSASLAPAVGDPGEVEVNPAETIYTFADEAAGADAEGNPSVETYELSVLHGSGPTGGHKGATRAEAEPLPYPIAGLPPRLGALHTDWTDGAPGAEPSGLVAAQLLAREALLQLRRERAEIEATYGPGVDVSLVRAVKESGSAGETRIFLPVHTEYDYRECTTKVNAVEVLRDASVAGGFRVTRDGTTSSSRAGSGTVSIVGRLGQLQQQTSTSGAIALTGAPLTGNVDSISLDEPLPDALEVLRTGSLVTVSGRRGGAWQFTMRAPQQAGDTALQVESQELGRSIPAGSGIFPSPGGVLSLITQHEDQIRDELIRDGDVVTSLVLDYEGLTLDGEKFVSDNFDGTFGLDADGLVRIASPGTEGYALTESGEAAFEGIYAREFITTDALTDAYTKAEADARYVEAAGDTMTGPLSLQGGGQLKGDGSGNVGVYAFDGTNLGTLVVQDLIVAGEVDQKNTNELAVSDQYIVTNAGQTGAPSLNGGLRVERGDQADAYWAWEEGLDTWGAKMAAAGSFKPAALRQAGLQEDLDADLIDGYHAAQLAALAENETITGAWTMQDVVTFDRPLSGANMLLDLQQGYGIYSDDVSGDNGAMKRLWFSAGENAQIVLGPRSGSYLLKDLRLSAEQTRIEGDAFLNGLIGSSSFSSGFAGSGWRIGADAGGEFQDLTVRGSLRLYELLLEQIRYQRGGHIFGPGGGKIKSASERSSDPGEWDVYFGEDEHSFDEGDIVMAQRFSQDGTSVVRRVVGEVAVIYSQTHIKLTHNNGNSTDGFAAGDELAVIGNSGRTAGRDGSIYITPTEEGAPYIDVLDGVTSYEDWQGSAKNKIRLGKLDGITSPVWGGLTGYGLRAENVYLEEAFFSGTVKVTGGNAETKEGAQARVDAVSDSLGSLAYDDAVEAAKLGDSILQGGYIKVELLDGDAIIANAASIAGITIEDNLLSGAAGNKYFRLSANLGATSTSHTSAPGLRMRDADSTKMISVGDIFNGSGAFGIAIFDDYGAGTRPFEVSTREQQVAGWQFDRNLFSRTISNSLVQLGNLGGKIGLQVDTSGGNVQMTSNGSVGRISWYEGTGDEIVIGDDYRGTLNGGGIRMRRNGNNLFMLDADGLFIGGPGARMGLLSVTDRLLMGSAGYITNPTNDFRVDSKGLSVRAGGAANDTERIARSYAFTDIGGGHSAGMWHDGFNLRIEQYTDRGLGGIILNAPNEYVTVKGSTSQFETDEVIMPNLPTSEKGTRGSLWVDSNGFVRYSGVNANKPPIAYFEWSVPAPEQSELLVSFESFSYDPDGSISSYNWDFGDGGSAITENPSHTYGSAGTYAVTLVVTDNDGDTSSYSQSVTVP